MCLAIIKGSKRVSVTLFMVTDSLRSQLLDCNQYSDTISNFLDAHLFQYELITFNEIAPGNVID